MEHVSKVLNGNWIIIFRSLVILCDPKEKVSFKPRLLEER